MNNQCKIIIYYWIVLFVVSMYLPFMSIPYYTFLSTIGCILSLQGTLMGIKALNKIAIVLYLIEIAQFVIIVIFVGILLGAIFYGPDASAIKIPEILSRSSIIIYLKTIVIWLIAIVIALVTNKIQLRNMRLDINENNANDKKINVRRRIIANTCVKTIVIILIYCCTLIMAIINSVYVNNSNYFNLFVILIISIIVYMYAALRKNIIAFNIGFLLAIFSLMILYSKMLMQIITKNSIFVSKKIGLVDIKYLIAIIIIITIITLYSTIEDKYFHDNRRNRVQ